MMASMNTAPAWVTYASLGVAALSLIVSAISATLALRNYRRGGVNVRLSCTWQITLEDGLYCEARVTNSGLSSVTVQEFHVVLLTSYLRHRLLDVYGKALLSGPELPSRLEGSHTEKWKFDIPYVDDRDKVKRLFRRPDEPVKTIRNRALEPWKATWAYLRMRIAPMRFFTKSIGVQTIVVLGNGIELSTRPDFRAFAFLLGGREAPLQAMQELKETTGDSRS